MNIRTLCLTTSMLLFRNSFSSEQIFKILYFDALIPRNIELRKRVITGLCCSDCDLLPKVENAGKVIELDDLPSYQLLHNGIKVLKDCYYGNWMTTLIQYSKGHHEPQEEKVFHEVLKLIPHNATMIELGSYWGFYSMWFKQQIKGARNFLVEPSLSNLIVGKKNFELNGMQGIFTQAMVGSFSAESQEFIDWDYTKGLVKQICIDDFAQENQIEFIHILHSDIQGAEVNMLKGCQKLLGERRIGYLFISTHRGVHEDCLRIIQDSNLEIIVSITREESFSADGLIVAKLPELPFPKNIEFSRRSQEFCALIDGII